MKTLDLPTRVVANPSEPPSASAKPGFTDSQLARWDVVSEIKKRWEDGEQAADTHAILADNPDLARDPSVVLDLAYAEYWARRKAGEDLDPVSYCERFPICQATLEQMLGIRKLLEANPSMVGAPARRIPHGPPDWPNPGDTYLGFTLLRELGSGAFARVFLASEAALGHRKVAIKIAREGDGEAETLGRIEHPHIVPIHSVKHDPATHLTIVCMPFVGETTLAKFMLGNLKRGKRPPRSARVVLDAVRTDTPPENAPSAVYTRGSYVEAVVDIGLGVARGLAFMHERGIVHRDIKPANVLMGPDAVPRILDFNLARDDDRTKPGDFGGTPTYMAPEQLEAMPAGRGALAQIGPAADLFSLGVILYQMLTCEHPFGPLDGITNLAELGVYLLNRMRRPHRPVTQFNPHADGELVRLVDQCLAVDPGQRPASADEVVARLEQIALRLRRRRERLARLPLRVAGIAALMLVLTGTAAAGIQYAGGLPLSPKQYHELGDEAFKQGNFGEAVDQYTYAVQKGEDSPDLKFKRALANQKLGAQFLASHAEKSKLSPKPPELDQARNSANAAFQAAIKDFDDMAASDWRAQAGIGYCKTQMVPGNTREACAAFLRAQELGANSPAVFADLGFCYFKGFPGIKLETQFQDAKGAFEQALALRPGYHRALHGLALIDLTQALNNGAFVPMEALPRIEAVLKPGQSHPGLFRDAACLYSVIAAKERVESEKRAAPIQAAGALGRGLGGDAFLAFFHEGVQATKPSGLTWEDLMNGSMRHAIWALDFGMDPKTLRHDEALVALRNYPPFQKLLEERSKDAAAMLRSQAVIPHMEFVDPNDAGGD